MAANFRTEGSHITAAPGRSAAFRVVAMSASSGPRKVTTRYPFCLSFAMTSRKFFSGHLLPRNLRPPTKTPTIEAPFFPTDDSIAAMPAVSSPPAKWSEPTSLICSSPRAVRNSVSLPYLLPACRRAPLKLYPRSHLPAQPARIGAPDKPTMNEANADCEQLTSTARSYRLERRRLINLGYSHSTRGNLRGAS